MKGIHFLEDWNSHTNKYESKTSYTLIFKSDDHNFSKKFTSIDIEDEQLSFEIPQSKRAKYDVRVQYNFITSGNEMVCDVDEKLDKRPGLV